MTNIIGKNALPIVGDTGRINISHLMNPGWRGALHVQQVGPIIFLTGAGLRPPADGNVELLTLPPQYIPDGVRLGEGMEGSDFCPAVIVGGVVTVRGVRAADVYVDINVVYTV